MKWLDTRKISPDFKFFCFAIAQLNLVEITKPKPLSTNCEQQRCVVVLEMILYYRDDLAGNDFVGMSLHWG